MKVCNRCKTNKNLTRDHIIPKRYGTTLVNNTMILCRSCHNWKEKHSHRVIKDGFDVGIYNPIMKKYIMFPRHLVYRQELKKEILKLRNNTV